MRALSPFSLPAGTHCPTTAGGIPRAAPGPAVPWLPPGAQVSVRQLHPLRPTPLGGTARGTGEGAPAPTLEQPSLCLPGAETDPLP